MRQASGWLAVLLAAVLAAALLGTAAWAAGPVGRLHQATKALADDIKSQRWAQNLPDNVRPTDALGSSKTVRFKLAMKGGKGSDSAGAYCFGYTLNCLARVVGPANRYSGTVTTSEGSRVEFEDKKAGQPLELVLDTSFWGNTTFEVTMEASDTPWPSEAVVEMECSY